MSDNYGFKKGFNNSAGLLYIYQGNSNLKGGKVQLPTSKVFEPDYQNEANLTKTLEYMRNGKHEKKTGRLHLKLVPGLDLKDGIITNTDMNNI